MISAWKPMLPGRKTAVVGSFKTRGWMLALLLASLLPYKATAFARGATTYRSTARSSGLALYAAAAKSSTPTLGLLSFDLDDTLFPTDQVVRSANEVMILRMYQIGCTDATIPLFLDNTRSIRKSLTEPVTYRDLRKMTIRKTLSESLNFKAASMKELDMLVEECYDAWVNERHAAAERWVFDDAIETLQTLREMYPDTCIAAITNGAGNPLVMSKTLAPFFDLRVSGEDDGVFPHRKPHPFIYEYTLQQCKSVDTNNNGSVVWCHVGDCLANDVGASASCGAQAIWMCTEEDEDSAAARLIDTKRVPEWSTASSSELERRAQQVVKGKESVAAKIQRLSELPEAIERILGRQ